MSEKLYGNENKIPTVLLAETLRQMKLEELDNRMRKMETSVGDLSERVDSLERYEKSVKDGEIGFHYETNKIPLIFEEKRKEDTKERLLRYVNLFKGLEKRSQLQEYLEELEENEDLQYQVQISAGIVGKIKEILKTVPKQDNNYRRKLLLLLHQAIKKNYSKHLFTEQQTDVLKRIAKSCNYAIVDKETYYQYDEELFNAELEVLPAWE